MAQLCLLLPGWESRLFSARLCTQLCFQILHTDVIRSPKVVLTYLGHVGHMTQISNMLLRAILSKWCSCWHLNQLGLGVWTTALCISFGVHLLLSPPSSTLLFLSVEFNKHSLDNCVPGSLVCRFFGMGYGVCQIDLAGRLGKLLHLSESQSLQWVSSNELTHTKCLS